MGDTSYTGNTSSFTTQHIWINRTSSSGYYYTVKESKKEKDFISEKEFKV